MYKIDLCRLPFSSLVATAILFWGGSAFATNSEDLKFVPRGIGIISPKGELNSMKLNFPIEPQALYNESGVKIGFSSVSDSSEFGTYSLQFSFTTHDTIRRLCEADDLCEVTYEGCCLIYREHRPGFVKILNDDPIPGGVWLSLSDLDKAGFQAMSWREFLTQQKKFDFPLPAEGLNLREQSSASSEQIYKILGKTNEIMLTGEWQGLWAYVEVKQWDGMPGVSSDKLHLIRTYKGWVKALDSMGAPNIWFYSRGC